MTDRTEARDQYIHGRSPEEVARLALLNELLNEGCLRELALRGELPGVIKASW